MFHGNSVVASHQGMRAAIESPVAEDISKNVDWPGTGWRLVQQVCCHFRLRGAFSLQKYGGATSAPSSQNAAEVSPGGAASVGAAMTSTKPTWVWGQVPRVKKRVISTPKVPAPGDCLTAS